jgi:quercetin dioxygenase-like cupin family protein
MMGIVHKYKGEEHDFDWEGVIEKRYQAADVRGVSAKVLVGPAEGAPNFRIRYFRVEPGGCTSLDQHAHDHGVFILHGRASVLLGNEEVEVEARDVVYVPGDEIHQFRALGQEPLGFLCVIPTI